MKMMFSKFSNSLPILMLLAVIMFVVAMYTPAFAVQYSEPGKRTDTPIQEWKLVVKATSQIRPLKTSAGISHLPKSMSVCMAEHRNAGNISFNSHFDGWGSRPIPVYTKNIRDAVTQLLEQKCDMAVVTESFLHEMGRARAAVREIASLRYRIGSQVLKTPFAVADGSAKTYIPDQTSDC